jgi:hypothetical protein
MKGFKVDVSQRDQNSCSSAGKNVCLYFVTAMDFGVPQRHPLRDKNGRGRLFLGLCSAWGHVCLDAVNSFLTSLLFQTKTIIILFTQHLLTQCTVKYFT